MTGISSVSGALNRYQNSFSKVDSNADGKLDRNELVSSRPNGMSEDQASKLYDKLSSGSQDGISKDQLQDKVETLRQSAKDKLGGEVAAMLLSQAQGGEGAATASAGEAQWDAVGTMLDTLETDDQE